MQKVRRRRPSAASSRYSCHNTLAMSKRANPPTTAPTPLLLLSPEHRNTLLPLYDINRPAAAPSLALQERTMHSLKPISSSKHRPPKSYYCTNTEVLVLHNHRRNNNTNHTILSAHQPNHFYAVTAWPSSSSSSSLTAEKNMHKNISPSLHSRPTTSGAPVNAAQDVYVIYSDDADGDGDGVGVGGCDCVTVTSPILACTGAFFCSGPGTKAFEGRNAAAGTSSDGGGRTGGGDEYEGMR